MTTKDIFRRMSGALESAGIPYMLTGSFASGFHGAVRATQDIDFVVAPTAEQLRHLARSLPEPDYYMNLDGALDALKRESQFNVIDLATGWKVDLIIRKSRPFSLVEFERRIDATVEGSRLYVATPEDVIIAKLEWAKAGGSQRQLEDVAGILRGETALDATYLDRWIRELGLETPWAAARLLA